MITGAWVQYKNSVLWRLVEKGVEVKGFGVERTGGAPATARRIYKTYEKDLVAAADKYNVPIEIIIACIATESGGAANAIRKEPGYISDVKTPHKISAGLMQTLISTARTAMKSEEIDRDWLLNARNSIMAGTAYLASLRSHTDMDPMKSAAAYNAGGVYWQKGAKNRWKMRMYPIGTGEHCDRFVKWFNDVFAVFALDGAPIGCQSLYVAYNGVAPASRPQVAATLLEKKDVIAVEATASSFWSKLQIGFAAVFGVPAAGSALFDSVAGVTDKVGGFFTRTLHMPDGSVKAILIAGVAVTAIAIYLNQRKVFAQHVENEISGVTDSTAYAGDGKTL